jgi:cytoskeletal protein CcmA (bactofilin family)
MSDLWKSHTPPAPPNVPAPASPSVPSPNTGVVTEHATIGRSVVIKGEVSGNEALFVDGSVEGAIRFSKHRVTVGRGSHVLADVHAQDVVVMGSVKGNIDCSDLLDIRAESWIEGKIVTKRIRIDDGAVLKGSVEIHASGRNAGAFAEQPLAKAAAASGDATKPAAPGQTPVPPAPPAAPEAIKRAPGSSVLFKPV